MALIRVVVLALLVAAIVCFGLYAATGAPTWRARGTVILKWTTLALVGFFALLILERVVRAL
jgi:hypothetical protein